MTTHDRLETWWSSLDEPARQHARNCITSRSLDEAFLNGLLAADIGLTRSGWAARGTTGGHIPRAIERFVEAHPLV